MCQKYGCMVKLRIAPFWNLNRTFVCVLSAVVEADFLLYLRYNSDYTSHNCSYNFDKWLNCCDSANYVQNMCIVYTLYIQYKCSGWVSHLWYIQNKHDYHTFHTIKPSHHTQLHNVQLHPIFRKNWTHIFLWFTHFLAYSIVYTLAHPCTLAHHQTITQFTQLHKQLHNSHNSKHSNNISNYRAIQTIPLKNPTSQRAHTAIFQTIPNIIPTNN